MVLIDSKAMEGADDVAESSMTPTQELCNALTMLLPSMVVGCSYWLSPNPGVAAILCGSLMYLPAAFAYHLSAACGRL